MTKSAYKPSTHDSYHQMPVPLPYQPGMRQSIHLGSIPAQVMIYVVHAGRVAGAIHTTKIKSAEL